MNGIDIRRDCGHLVVYGDQGVMLMVGTCASCRNETATTASTIRVKWKALANGHGQTPLYL